VGDFGTGAITVVVPVDPPGAPDTGCLLHGHGPVGPGAHPVRPCAVPRLP